MSSKPSSRPAHAGHACGHALSVLELSLVLEELDRVVGELGESLAALALPFDEASHLAAFDAIRAARRR